MKITLLLIPVLFMFGCDKKKECPAYKIYQVYNFHQPEYYSQPGWYLKTYAYKGQRIIESWSIRTDNPDTVKAKHIILAKEYIEMSKIRKDTTIYINQ